MMGIHRNTTPSTKSSADKASEVQLMKVIKLVQVDYFGKLLNFVKTDAEKKRTKQQANLQFRGSIHRL